MNAQYHIERLRKLLTNSEFEGIYEIVDDFLSMLEHPIEKPHAPTDDDDCPFN